MPDRIDTLVSLLSVKPEAASSLRVALTDWISRSSHSKATLPNIAERPVRFPSWCRPVQALLTDLQQAHHLPTAFIYTAIDILHQHRYRRKQREDDLEQTIAPAFSNVPLPSSTQRISDWKQRRAVLERASRIPVEEIEINTANPLFPEEEEPTRKFTLFSDVSPHRETIAAPTSPREPPSPLQPPKRFSERFDDRGLIGHGGMGEVRRVYDTVLKREVAVKSLHGQFGTHYDAVSRFVAEAQATGQLQHPGIVPVYDLGRLPDGSVYYTMREVDGQEFGFLIDAVHEARTPAGYWRETADGWTFRRLIDVLHRICEAIAYAHSRGVVHRDLKPDNILVGEFGETLVVDWGLAKILPHSSVSIDDQAPVQTTRSQEYLRGTMTGQIAGTPCYMAPEQCTGDTDKQGPPADVYALGAILYEILSGAPPHDDAPNGVKGILAATVQSDPIPLGESPHLPSGLVQICTRALQRDPAKRFPSAKELSAELGAYLDGAKKRERAMEFLTAARDKHTQCERLRKRAKAVLQASVDLDSHTEGQSPRWKKHEEFKQLNQGAEVLGTVFTQLAGAALAQDPELSDAHRLLAKHYHAQHLQAEARHDQAATEHFRLLLNAHDRGHYSAYLKGTGWLSLSVNKQGCVAHIERLKKNLFTQVFEPVFTTPLPIERLELPMGSYRIRLEHDQCSPLIYPFSIRRQEHWNSVEPGHTETEALRLPYSNELTPSESFIPGGWFHFGDSDQSTTLPSGHLWVDPFFMSQHPITHSEYLEFILYLQKTHQHELVDELAPRSPNVAGRKGPLIYRTDPHGNFRLPSTWEPDAPATFICWLGATTFAEWRSKLDGLPWRLPHELEWEKAARGADERPFPSGEHCDPRSVCCWNEQRAEEPSRIRSYSDDRSPYGVFGLGGNVRDWCANPFALVPPYLKRQRLSLNSSEVDDDGHRCARGGTWDSEPNRCKALLRHHFHPEHRSSSLGFRLVRSF